MLNRLQLCNSEHPHRHSNCGSGHPPVGFLGKQEERVAETLKGRLNGASYDTSLPLRLLCSESTQSVNNCTMLEATTASLSSQG